MAKSLALLERLEIALGLASSDSEKDFIYASLFTVARRATEVGFDEFYSKELRYDSLSPLDYDEGTLDPEQVRGGREIGSIIKKKIILPDPSKKGFGKKYKRARTMEFKLLRSYFLEEDGGT